MARNGTVLAIDGSTIHLQADTICVHSDTPGAGEIGPAVRAAVEEAGVAVSSELRPHAATRNVTNRAEAAEG